MHVNLTPVGFKRGRLGFLAGTSCGDPLISYTKSPHSGVNVGQVYKITLKVTQPLRIM